MGKIRSIHYFPRPLPPQQMLHAAHLDLKVGQIFSIVVIGITALFLLKIFVDFWNTRNVRQQDDPPPESIPDPTRVTEPVNLSSLNRRILENPLLSSRPSPSSSSSSDARPSRPSTRVQTRIAEPINPSSLERRNLENPSFPSQPQPHSSSAQPAPIAPSQASASKSAPINPQSIPEEDLILIKSYLTLPNLPETISHEFGTSRLYYRFDNASSTIHITAIRSTYISGLKLQIDAEGKILSITENGALLPSLIPPPIWNARINYLSKTILLEVCHYNSDTVITPDFRITPILQIVLLRRSLKIDPRSHITKFANSLELEWNRSQIPHMLVSFLKNDLTFENGRDAGGLSKDYLNDLMTYLLQEKELFFKFEESSLALPQLDKPNTGASFIYEALGKVLMYCYLTNSDPDSRSIMIGWHFDEALFKVLLSLRAADIDGDVPLQRRLELARILVDARSGTNYHVDYLKERLNLLLKKTLTGTDLEKAAQIACEADCCKAYMLEDEPNMNAIRLFPDLFMTSFAETVLDVNGSHGQLGKQISAILSIAVGMKHSLSRYLQRTMSNPSLQAVNAYWDNVIASSTDLTNMVQGSIDRNQIINRISLNEHCKSDAEIQKKTKWLKSWLANDATAGEIRAFLIYVVGAPGLPANKNITIMMQNGLPYIPMPRAHSCILTMELSPQPCTYGSDYNDHSSSKFIECVKIALADPSAYHMA